MNHETRNMKHANCFKIHDSCSKSLGFTPTPRQAVSPCGRKAPPARSVWGFTLIEITIATAILMMLAGLGLIVGMDLYRSNILETERDNFVNALQKARTQAQANIGGSPHGVAIDDNSYTVFRGASYAERDQAHDEKFLISPIVTATGLTEIVFNQLDGGANATGEIVLVDKRNILRTLSINSEGRIDW